MFWKIILWIYLGVSALCLLMFICIVSSVNKSLTEEEKTLLKERCKGGGFAYKVMSYTRATILLFLPIVNAGALFIMVADTDEIIEKIKLQMYGIIKER